MHRACIRWALSSRHSSLFSRMYSSPQPRRLPPRVHGHASAEPPTPESSARTAASPSPLRQRAGHAPAVLLTRVSSARTAESLDPPERRFTAAISAAGSPRIPRTLRSSARSAAIRLMQTISSERELNSTNYHSQYTAGGLCALYKIPERHIYYVNSRYFQETRI